FNGAYHVLGGLISPTDGLTPDKLHIKELASRLKKLADSGQPVEIILAMNPTTEGDTTALYIEKLLAPLKIRITKLNRGLSTGSDLEYADESTLLNALKYRH
ncbi:MAG: recombination protein RecR, partial [Parcubacteria group bacterium LiPW_39]